MKNDVKLIDIECFPNYFELGIKNYKTKEVINLEISEIQDDRKEIYDFLRTYDGYLVSFNGIHYDNVVLKYFLINYSKLNKLSKQDLLQSLKQFSDAVIHDGLRRDQLRKYKYSKTNWQDIDLYCYWSKMLRMSKKISLKSLGIQLNYPVVQELPFDPNEPLSKDQILIVRNYNNTHDLGILDFLMQKMIPDITLRKSIRQEYDLDCMSWDAIKIASEALLQDYCNVTGKDLYETRNLRFSKPTIYVKDILSDFDPQFKLPVFQKLYQRVLNSVNDFSEELLVIENNTSLLLSYGIGGLHNLFKNKMYETNDRFQIKTSDFGSLYPNIIINYACFRFSEVLNRYKAVKHERMAAKKAGRKTEDSFKKLILNGTSGLLDQEHSWLYYPEGALRMRLIGQLILTKVIEVCILNNWQVISANTDGVEVIIPKKANDYIDAEGNVVLGAYSLALQEVERQFDIGLEHEDYKFIYYVNVNNYIALTEKGKPKRKGLFKLGLNEKNESEIPLGDSVNELVIPKALSNYFIHKIPVQETICNPEKYGLTILDYCNSNKISKKDYEVIWNNQVVQNLNRYYFSKNSPFLFKRRKKTSSKYKGTSNLEHINAGWSVTLYNEHVEKPFSEYNVNYAYYISTANEIINSLQREKRELSLFDI